MSDMALKFLPISTANLDELLHSYPPKYRQSILAFMYAALKRCQRKDNGLLKRGEFFFGRKELAAEIGMSEQNLRTILEMLENTSELTKKTTSKSTKSGSTGTIVKFDSYVIDGLKINQENDQETNQDSTSIQPGFNHSLNVNVNEKGTTTPAKPRRGRAKKVQPEPTPEAWMCLEAWEKRAPLPFSKSPEQYRVQCALVFDALNGPRQLAWPRVHAICKFALSSWYPKYLGSPLGLIEKTSAGDMEKWQKIEQQSKPTEASHEVTYQEMPVLYGTR